MPGDRDRRSIERRTQISHIYKQLVKTAQIEDRVVKRISGHSLRIKAAQGLLVQEASRAQIMVKGGWMKTDTVIRYVERVRSYVRPELHSSIEQERINV